MYTIAAVQKIHELFIEAQVDIQKNPVPETVEAFRVQYLGKKSYLSDLMECIKTASQDQRPVLGKEINQLRKTIDDFLVEMKGHVKKFQLEKELSKDQVDVSRPVAVNQSSLHPVTLMIAELYQIFQRLGFDVYDGPEIDFEFYNFTALNVQEDHPARDMQDTFYIAGHSDRVLRTHTSNIQIHCMLNERPPLKIIAPGRVFRCDSDATHTPMFHQIEGFVVDRGVTMAHMKGTIDSFLKAIYGPKAKCRFRPSFFPFTEPSAEFDMECRACSGGGCKLCKNTGWLEIGGCGMIHPNVFETVEYDSEIYSGFAFGFGIDRMAMLQFGFNDLRQLFATDVEFLKQFPVHYISKGLK